MDALSLTLIVIVLTCIFIFFSRSRQKYRLPPGPPGLPLLGNLLDVRERDYLQYTKYKKYGDICSIRIGRRLAVVLNSYNAIHEAFVVHADVFSGRPHSALVDKVARNSGVVFTDGPLWQEHRRFLLRTLREFGLGRQMGERIVLDECLAMKDSLLEHQERPVSTQDFFTSIINNVIARLTFNERCGADDPKFKEFCLHLEETLTFSIIDRLLSVSPRVGRIPIIGKFLFKFSDVKTRMELMYPYVTSRIQSHAENLRSTGVPLAEIDEPSDVCDVILIEQAKQEASNPGGHTFTKWQLIRNLFELFLAGTETTASTLNWMAALLATHPEIQKRVQQEIERVIGREKPPTMAHRPQLPYVCAVIDEVLRFSSLVPSNLPHRNTADVEICGYVIPANTLIISNLFGVHRDPQLWAKPEEFYPDHFLSSDGDYQPSKYLIPFSIGKRSCLGESLARMEIFLSTVTLMQNFSVSLADSGTDVKTLLFGGSAGIRRPGQHQIIFRQLSG